MHFLYVKLQARIGTMRHLVTNCDKLFDMYSALLEIVAADEDSGGCDVEDAGGGGGLLDTFEYLRISWRDILRLDEDIESADYADHPLDSICLGVLESRSFLFKYSYEGEDAEEDDVAKAAEKAKKAKVQRSQSERSKDRRNRTGGGGGVNRSDSGSKGGSAASGTSTSAANKSSSGKVLVTQKSFPSKVENKFLNNAFMQR